MKDIVKIIYDCCQAYLTDVKLLGNESAYTDSLVELIINKANELKIKYDKEVPINTN